MAQYASDLITTTFEKRSAGAFDNLTNSNAILKALKENDGIEKFSGGTEIVQILDVTANTNAGWFNGYDTVPVSPVDVLDAAKFTPKQASVQVAISGRERLLNAGDSQVMSVVKAKMKNAERSLTELIVNGLHSDGTANSSKQLTGLKAAITTTPAVGTYGAIDRATYTFWRNKKLKGAGSDYVGTLSTSNVRELFTKMINNLTRGTDKPNLIIADSNFYAILLAAMQTQQQFVKPSEAGFGFTNVDFMGIPVILENSPGMSANTAYFLNTDFLKLYVHSKCNFTPLGEARTPVNQDAEITMLGWMGQLAVSNLALQGIIAD